MVGYRRIAIEVLLRAVEDFHGSSRDGSTHHRSEHGPTYPRVFHARRRVDAGRFLIVRTDGLRDLWFKLAGYEPNVFARQERFVEMLREAEEELERAEAASREEVRRRLEERRQMVSSTNVEVDPIL